MKQPKIPVKMLTTLTILMVFLCVGSYLLSPKWQAVRAEYQRQRDPLHQFASQQTPEAQLQALQDKIRANPQNSEQWALLGEYYLWQNDYSNSLLAYRQALQLRGENAELYAALATVLYYQASQHMTAQTRAMIDKALALDSNEITALMLLASRGSSSVPGGPTANSAGAAGGSGIRWKTPLYYPGFLPLRCCTVCP
jgi:formate-dependent nitrite reductase complex subunit NrfG